MPSNGDASGGWFSPVHHEPNIHGKCLLKTLEYLFDATLEQRRRGCGVVCILVEIHVSVEGFHGFNGCLLVGEAETGPFQHSGKKCNGQVGKSGDGEVGTVSGGWTRRNKIVRRIVVGSW